MLWLSALLLLLCMTLLVSADPRQRRRRTRAALPPAHQRLRRTLALLCGSAALPVAIMALPLGYATLFWLLGLGLIGMAVAVFHGLHVGSNAAP